MAKLDARSVIIILASFALVAGTLILVQKRNASADSAASSGAQSLTLNPPSAPIEMLGGGPAPAPAGSAPAPVASVPAHPVSAPASAAASTAKAHAIPAEPGSAASAAKPASSAAAKPAASAAVRPASSPAPASAGAAKNHAIPAESEPAAPKSAAQPVSTPAPAKPVSAAKSAPAGHFFLQAGAFKDEGNAQKLLDKIKTAGFNAQIAASGELHKVLAGPYATADAAGAARAKLKTAGFDTFPAKQ